MPIQPESQQGARRQQTRWLHTRKIDLNPIARTEILDVHRVWPKGQQLTELISVDASTALQEQPRRARPERPAIVFRSGRV